MKKENLEEFMTTLTAVAELYGKRLSEPMLMIYWNALMVYPFEDVKRAFTKHAVNPDNGQFMPKPADLVRIIDGDSQTRSMMAWTKVINAARRIGGGVSVVFDDPLIMATLRDMGGWEAVCMMKADEEPFRMRDFDKIYSGYLINPPKDYPALLVGRYETYNSAHGFETEQPLLIGSPDKALAVFNSGARRSGLLIRAMDSAMRMIKGGSDG